VEDEELAGTFLSQYSQYSEAEVEMRKIPQPDEQPTMKLWPDVGRALRLKRSATYAAAQRGQIPTLRIGGKVLVPTACLRRMLQLDQVADVEVVGPGGGSPDESA